jgi:predicted nucleic acid-binding protein
MNILADSSVWIDHFRHDSEDLKQVILQNRIFVHPFVLGELACGSLKNRKETLLFMQNLPVPIQPTHEEVFEFIEKEKLYGKGVGLVDIHILMSSILTGCALWTFDKKLSLLQKKLKIQSIQ